MKKEKVTRVNRTKVALEELRGIAKAFARAVTNRKTIAAFTYKVSNQPSLQASPNSLSNSAPVAGTISQRNVVAIDELCNHVLTAAKLGYETRLSSCSGELTVSFIEKNPPTPIELLY